MLHYEQIGLLTMFTRCRGFTLIELVVVLAILGILFALGIPTFTDWIANTRVRSTAEALQNALRKAEAEAIRRNHQTAFVLTSANPPIATSAGSTSGTNWFIRLVNVAGTETGASVTANSGSGGFLIAREVFGSTSGVVMAASNAMICFNSLGRLTANTSVTSDAYTLACAVPAAANSFVTYNISRPGASLRLRVNVSLGGQVRMCYPDKPALSATTPDGCP